VRQWEGLAGRLAGWPAKLLPGVAACRYSEACSSSGGWHLPAAALWMNVQFGLTWPAQPCLRLPALL
jgi:hypothetical protein